MAVPRPTGFMRHRALHAGGLLLALLASAWGNVFAASRCPHMKQGHACCHMRASRRPASQQGMTDMQMGDARGGPAAEQTPGADALGLPDELCEHCMGHSPSHASPAALRLAVQPRRDGSVTPPPLPSVSVAVAAVFARTPAAREHAPPASGAARHVLIAVFRI